MWPPVSTKTSSRRASSTQPRSTRSALQNAASISGLLLTTEALVTEIPEKEKTPPMPPAAAEWAEWTTNSGTSGTTSTLTRTSSVNKNQAALGKLEAAFLFENNLRGRLWRES